MSDVYNIEWSVLKCFLTDCNYIWLQDMGEYKRCPMCGHKYKAIRLQSGRISS